MTERIPTTPPKTEILTTGDFLRSKVSNAMGALARRRAEGKIDTYLNTIRNEDTAGNPERQAQNDAYLSYRDNLVDSYVADKKVEKEYKHKKQEYTLKRIGRAAMWVPGIDIIGNRIIEAQNTRKIDKQIRRAYLSKRGGFMGGVRGIRESNQEKHGKEKRILESFSDYVAANNKTWHNVDS